MNHLRILEGVLTEARKTFSQRELIALAYTHITSNCQNRRERRQAYRIAAKILKCDRRLLQKLCERIQEIESRLGLNIGGGRGDV